MDSKVLKTTLKTAAAHIKDQEYKDAVKACQKILDALPGNYRALVFLGKAAEGLNQFDHALKAYRQAIDASPEEMIAWQGLNKLYEKNPPSKTKDHTEVFEKLVLLTTSDEQKHEECIYQLALHLSTSYNYDEKVLKEVNGLISRISSVERKVHVKLSLARFCYKSSAKDVKQQAIALLAAVFSKSIYEEKDQELWQFYATQIYLTGGSLSEVLEVSTKLSDTFRSSKCLSEILAEIICNYKLCKLDLPGTVSCGKIDNLSSPLEDLYTFLTGDDVKLDGQVYEKLKSSSQPFATITLINHYISLKSYRETTALLKRAEKQIQGLPACLADCQQKYKEILSSLRVSLAYKQRQYQHVITLCTESLQKEFRNEFLISLVECDKAEEVEKDLDSSKHDDNTILGYLRIKQSRYQEGYDILLSALKQSPKSVNANLWLGQACYLLSNKEKETTKYLLTAAKLDPQNEMAFYYLGLHYLKLGDKDRGLKCLKKSYSLSPAHDEICTAYVDELMAQGQNEQALDILLQTTKLSSSGSCKWAWFRLGILRSNEGNLTDAINCLQQVLRADESDSNGWECLADCYVKRGSFVAAIGAYEKACELNPLSIYPRYQIALTKQKLALLPEALDQFQQILQQEPNYTPALKGIGDVHIAVARDALKQCIYGKAVSNIEKALQYIIRAAMLRRDLSCVWKSLGDVLTLTHLLPADSSLECPAMLSSLKPSDVKKDSIVRVSREQALTIGSRCYSQCRYLRDTNSFSWHDLAVNSLYQARCSLDDSVKKTLLQNAAKFSLKAISQDKTVVAHYNCLGAIYMEKDFYDPSAAQHYLCVGLELDSNNVQGWTNLAALYLKEGDADLAHEALNIAQSADPKYNECWTGQAIVAEMIGHSEAMDLFRHTTELGNNTESFVGYAQWVMTTLLDVEKRNTANFRYAIDRLEAIPVACDGIGHVIDQNPSAQALNVYGLLLERQGLLQMSVKSLSRCVYLAQQEIDGASVNDVKDLDAYRSNLARVLCSIGDTDSSSKAIQQIQLISEPSRENKSVEALAYVKQAKLAKADPYDNKTPAAELYQSAFSTYSALLEMTTDLEMKSHVYAAMGMLAVKCGDTETAKTAFFQCSESESPSIYGLAGLCSLALLSGDGELAVAALNELIKGGESKEAIKLKAVFNSYLSALDGDMRSARNHLLKAIHCYPSDSDLHDQLIALSIGSLQSNRESILRLSQSVTDVQDLVGLSSLAAGHIQEGLKWAQNAVHLYPDQSKNWMLLLNACYSAEKLSTRNITSKTINTLLNYSEIIADRLNPKQKVWLSEMVLCYTAEYDPQNFTNVLNKHVEFLDGSTLVESLNAFLSKQEISNPADMLSILLNAKLKSSNSPETVNLLKEAVGIKPGIGVMIAKALLDMSMEKRSETKTEFFSSLEGLETSPSAKLLSALYHWFISKNKRLAVKNFRTVMDLLNGRDSYESSIASNFVHHWDTEKQKKEETDK